MRLYLSWENCTENLHSNFLAFFWIETWTSVECEGARHEWTKQSDDQLWRQPVVMANSIENKTISTNYRYLIWLAWSKSVTFFGLFIDERTHAHIRGNRNLRHVLSFLCFCQYFDVNFSVWTVTQSIPAIDLIESVDHSEHLPLPFWVK